MTTTATTFTWEQAEPLGDAITDWTWEWTKAHPRARTIGAMFQRELTVFIDEQTELPTKQARDLAREICWWTNVWLRAANAGTADSEFGAEWRHSLQRFLMLSVEQRVEWFGRHYEWKIHNVHFDVGDDAFQQDRPDYPIDVKGVAVRGPVYDHLGNSHVVAFVTCGWDEADEVVTQLKAGLPDGYDAHTVIVDVRGVPVFDGVAAYLDSLVEDAE